MNKQPKIYFAYGSNLNLEDMKVRCPTDRCAQSRPLCSHRCL